MLKYLFIEKTVDPDGGEFLEGFCVEDADGVRADGEGDHHGRRLADGVETFLWSVGLAEADKKLFQENALWLIGNFITDNVMKAEFYREAGDMEKAKDLIEKVTGGGDDFMFMKKNVATMKEKINKGDTGVFLIK